MRVYNVVTESKYTGLYIPETSCTDMLIRARFLLRQNIDLDDCMIQATNILSKLLSIQPNVVFNLCSLTEGNLPLVRLSAFGAILSDLLNIDNEMVLEMAYDLCTEFIDIEIEEGK